MRTHSLLFITWKKFARGLRNALSKHTIWCSAATMQWNSALPPRWIFHDWWGTRLRYNIVSVSLYDSSSFGYGTITSGIKRPHSRYFLQTQWYIWPLATLAGTNIRRTRSFSSLASLGPSALWKTACFGFPPALTFFLSAHMDWTWGSIGLLPFSFYSLRIRHIWIRYIWYINFFSGILVESYGTWLLLQRLDDAS